MDAAREHQFDIVNDWLANDNDINAEDSRFGRTLLHWIAGGEVTAADVGQARDLLGCGADLNHCDPDGFCALHWAARGIGSASPAMVAALVAAGADLEKKKRTEFQENSTPLGVCLMASLYGNVNSLEIARILLRGGASLDRVKEDYTAEWVLAEELPHIARDEQTRLLETLVHGERSRRNTISAVARLRSYANRDRLSAQVLILDRRALTTVQFYSALFGLPDELFRKVVRAL